MRLTALINFKYGTRWYKPGDALEADEKYARTLVALRHAKIAETSQPKPPPAAPPPAPVREAPPAPKPESPKSEGKSPKSTKVEPSKRGEYPTRRMRAKD